MLEYDRGTRFESTSLVRFGPLELDVSSREAEAQRELRPPANSAVRDPADASGAIAASSSREVNCVHGYFERWADPGDDFATRLFAQSYRRHLAERCRERTMSDCLSVQTDVANEIARSLAMEFNTCRRNFEATGTVL